MCMNAWRKTWGTLKLCQDDVKKSILCFGSSSSFIWIVGVSEQGYPWSGLFSISQDNMWQHDQIVITQAYIRLKHTFISQITIFLLSES